MRVRELFYRKIYDELQEYRKKSQLNGSDICDSDKWEVFSNIYNILVSSADDFSDALLLKLVNQSTSILESLYENLDDPIGRDDLADCVKSEINNTIGYCNYDEDYDWWNNPE